MKKINFINALFYCYEGMWPELDRFSINLFYYRLGDVLYSILDENGYFDEED
jgi:hypothetical protein